MFSLDPLWKPDRFLRSQDVGSKEHVGLIVLKETLSGRVLKKDLSFSLEGAHGEGGITRPIL